MLQASHGYEKASDTLLHHGADVTITDDNGTFNSWLLIPISVFKVNVHVYTCI